MKQHVGRQLTAYCYGELAPEEARQVGEHLLACQRCRQEYEEVKLGVHLAAQLPARPAPPSLWGEIEARLDETLAPARRGPGLRFAPGWRPLAALAAALALLFVGAFWYFSRPERAARPPEVVRQPEPPPVLSPSPSAPDAGRLPPRPRPRRPGTRASFEVARLDGSPKVADSPIGPTGRLGVGEWLETDAASRAQIQVADLGHVEVAPNSRIRLVTTRATEHRLALARGRVEAQILAPPRLFIVETPSAVAVDLGCAYTLEVDKSGGSLLHVTSGYVELEGRGRQSSYVPAGALCATRPGVGPGTPYFEDATGTFRAALGQFDFARGGARALDTVLAAARRRDTLTLWHLLERVDAGERGRVYDRLAELFGPPDGVTREGVLGLDPGMLERYRQHLRWVW